MSLEEYSFSSRLTLGNPSLKTGLTAEESVDGLSHQNILPEDADLNDPWGGEYLIETSTDGSGSITTSNAVSVGGLESEVTLSW